MSMNSTVPRHGYVTSGRILFSPFLNVSCRVSRLIVTLLPVDQFPVESNINRFAIISNRE